MGAILALHARGTSTQKVSKKEGERRETEVRHLGGKLFLITDRRVMYCRQQGYILLGWISGQSVRSAGVYFYSCSVLLSFLQGCLHMIIIVWPVW